MGSVSIPRTLVGVGEHGLEPTVPSPVESVPTHVSIAKHGPTGLRITRFELCQIFDDWRCSGVVTKQAAAARLPSQSGAI
jgi:hypothetical protein